MPLLKWFFFAGGVAISLLGFAFWVIDGGSLFARGVCATGVLVAIGSLVPDVIRLGKRAVAAVQSIEVSIDQEGVAQNKAAVVRGVRSLVGVAGKLLFVLLLLVGGIAVVAVVINVVSQVGSTVTSGGGGFAPRDKQSPGIHRIEVGVGKVIITRKAQGLSHINIRCNNGLIIDADWRVNLANDFGYDLYEPEVSETTNRMAVMMTTRGILAAYLRGEYD